MAVIPQQEPHQILTRIAADGHSFPDKFPMAAILESSAYYPASGLDADPVRILSPSIRSFVYCDNRIDLRQVEQEINTKGFRGYRLELKRQLNLADIFGEMTVPPRLTRRFRFALWSLWQGETPNKWFSLLFVSGDGVDVYSSFYGSRGIQPTVLCLIQPGEAFGGNCTNFFDPAAHLYKAVSKSETRPKYLLVGGHHGKDFFSECCWPSYKLHCKPQPQYIPEDSFIDTHERGKGKVLRLWEFVTNSVGEED